MRAALFALLLALTACGSSSARSNAGGDDGGTGADATGEAAAMCPPMDAAIIDDAPLPTASSIQFSATAPVPSGEQLLFNDWNPQPNAVSSLSVDGATKTEIFRVYRAWSMGVSHDGKSIAFSCGDPMQQADFGLQIGDSIQQTFVYDVPTQAVALVAHGDINDECHTFGPGDTALWVCRRYDFAETGDGGNLTGTNRGYRIGRIDRPSDAFAFLTPEDPTTLALWPQPTPDGQTLLYSTSQAVSATVTKNTVMSLGLPCGSSTVVRSDARAPALSPDGTRYVYADDTLKGALYLSPLDGSSKPVLISSQAGDSPVFSPDGTRVAYLFFDSTANCSHIEVVQADGSQAASPTRLRDCGKTGEFITQVAWFVEP